MGKYRITATIELSTTFDPDGYFVGVDELEEFEAEFYNSANQDLEAAVPCTFMVEADSEEDAQEEANTVLGNVSFSEGYGGVAWVVDDYSIDDVEEIEAPRPSLEAALETLSDYVANGDEDDLLRAIDVVLVDYHAKVAQIEDQAARLTVLEAQMQDLRSRIDATVVA